MTEAGLALSLV